MVGESEAPEVLDSTSETSLLWDTFIPLKPVPCPRPRVARGIAYMPKEYKQAKAKLVTFLKGAYHGDMITQPVGVHLIFSVPKPKTVKRPYPSVVPDVDNLAKTILDAFNDAGIWKDDCLVVDLLIQKRYAEDARIGTDVIIVGL